MDLTRFQTCFYCSPSFTITANRAIEAFLALFANSVLGNGALERLVNASNQIVTEGKCYPQKLSPHWQLLAQFESGDQF